MSSSLPSKGMAAAQIRAQLAACGAALLGDTLYGHAALRPAGSAPGQPSLGRAAAQHGATNPRGDGAVLERVESARSAGDDGALDGLPHAPGAHASLCCHAPAGEDGCAGDRTGVANGEPFPCKEISLDTEGPALDAVCMSTGRKSSAGGCSCSSDPHAEAQPTPRRPDAIGLQAWRLEIDDGRGLFGEAGIAAFEASQPWWRNA